MAMGKRAEVSQSEAARYWCAVACRDHVQRGVTEGIAQVGHGKRGPLDRMKPGDGIVYYSPAFELGGTEKCQAFTAIGYIARGESYAHAMSKTFVPFRRDVRYRKAQDAPIRPLLDELSFTRGVKSWGAKFRFGHFEISAADFALILSRMTPSARASRSAGATKRKGKRSEAAPRRRKPKPQG
jgi:EVE domain